MIIISTLSVDFIPGSDMKPRPRPHQVTILIDASCRAIPNKILVSSFNIIHLHTL